MKTTPAIRILERPIAEWPLAILATHTPPRDIEAELAAMIQRATLLHTYIGHRYNRDQGHADSAKAANRALVKVRKALGYSYPKNIGR